MPRARPLAALLLALAAAAGCGADRPVTTTTAAATSAPATAPPAALTVHEREACRRWGELAAGQHQASIGEMVRWVRFNVAAEAWVDAEGRAVHTAAVALAERIERGDTGAPLDDALRGLNGACSPAG